MCRFWLQWGLVAGALAMAEPALAQFQPGMMGMAPPGPEAAFAQPGIFGQTPPRPSGYGSGPGAFLPASAAFEPPPPAPPEGAEAPCPDPGPLIPYKFPSCGDETCPPSCSVWFEFLFLWQKANRVSIPTLTRGSPADAVPGAIGQPGTSVLIGDQSFGYGVIPAFRTGVTYWLQPRHLAVDLEFFIADNETATLEAAAPAGPNDPVIARPFFNTETKQEDADPRSNPLLLRGNVRESYLTRLFGSELNLRWFAGDSETSVGGSSMQLLLGFRQLKLDDRLTMDDQVTNLINRRTTFITDEFTTYNQFYGGQVGALARWRWDERLVTSVHGKFAVGPNFQQINASGSTRVTNLAGDLLNSDNIGLYVQPTNRGSYRRTGILYVPEVGINIGIDVNEHIRLRTGYTAVFLTGVVRPGDQLDRGINQQPLNAPALVGTTARPAPPPFRETDIWFHFVNLGVEFSF